jgi:hypothetical protein
MELPKFAKIKQLFSADSIESCESVVTSEIEKILQGSSLSPGARIAITAGSRGIHNIVEILKVTVSTLQKAGYSPFLFASAGSHGRGEAEGQKEILNSLGITEENIGASISCSAEVVHLGTTESFLPGLPIYAAKEAAEADAILVVNRVKLHTNFRGEVESGLMKMMAVGMGRAVGASMVHRLGNEHMENAIKAIGSGILSHLPVIGGLAILENALEKTALIQGIKAKDILHEEPPLLEKAKGLMPSLPVQSLDLCVIRQIGKNFSGTGMDTNIVGRIRITGMDEPRSPAIKYLGVLDLSEESHGNALGIGLADFTTKRLVDKIDYDATYTNVLTSGNVTRAAVPMTLQNDRHLLATAMRALKPEDPTKVKIMIIKNTLHLDEMWISQALLPLIEEDPTIEVIHEPINLTFDETNNLILH